MRPGLSRVPFSLAGILLILLGLVFLFSPTIAMSTLSILFGLAILACGLADIVAYSGMRGTVPGAGRMLAEGILTVLLALLVLLNHWIAGFSLSWILGLWLLLTGLSRITGALDLRALGYTGWGWMLALGIVLAVLALIAFFDPMAGFSAISAMLGVGMLILGLVLLLWGYMSRWLWM